MAEDGSDIKIKHCCVHIKIPRSFVTRFCAYNGPRYQVSFYRTIGSLVLIIAQNTDCVSSNEKTIYVSSNNKNTTTNPSFTHTNVRVEGGDLNDMGLNMINLYLSLYYLSHCVSNLVILALHPTIMLSPCNLDPPTPHFNILKPGFQGFTSFLS